MVVHVTNLTPGSACSPTVVAHPDELVREEPQQARDKGGHLLPLAAAAPFASIRGRRGGGGVGGEHHDGATAVAVMRLALHRIAGVGVGRGDDTRGYGGSGGGDVRRLRKFVLQRES
jgi:hypothetical protein